MNVIYIYIYSKYFNLYNLNIFNCFFFYNFPNTSNVIISRGSKNYRQINFEPTSNKDLFVIFKEETCANNTKPN